MPSSECSSGPGGRRSSASTVVRPLSTSTRWNSCGPSPAVTPVHSDVYGFIRSAVEERGRSWRYTSKSSQVGITFSIPITVMSISGNVVHIRALPSDSTTATVPVSRDGEVGAADPDLGAQEQACADGAERPRRVRAGRQRGRAGRRHRASARNSSRISARFLWIAGTRMCDGVSPAELDDELREVGLPRPDPARGERLVELRLLGRQRLRLDDLRRAVRGDEIADDRVCLLAVTGPVDRPAGPRDRRLELDQVRIEMAKHPLLDRPSGFPQLLPSPAPRRPRPRAWRGSRAWHARGCGAAACPRARRVRLPGTAPSVSSRPSSAHLVGRGEDLGEVHRPHAGRWRESAPPMCIRHEFVGRGADLGAGVEDRRGPCR